MIVNIDGIDVQIVKKKIRNIRLTISAVDGSVKLSAPHNVRQADIERVVQGKMQWIKKHVERINSLPKLVEREYVSGEVIYVFGQRFELALQDTKCAERIRIFGDKIILSEDKQSTLSQRKKHVEDWLRKLLRVKAEDMLDMWERITGLKCSGFQIRNMKTRWGTCNTQRKFIWLNLQLVKRTESCVEYVVLHELVHLLERGHGKAFKAIMDKFMPDWRERKKQLNVKQDNFMGEL